MKKYVFCLIGLITLFTEGLGHDNTPPIPAQEITTCQATPETAEAGVTGFFTNLFQTDSWPARWQCGSWSDFHGWLYISSDVLIWAAYFIIPLMLGYFVHRRSIDIPFKSIFLLFMGFILACGLTHLIDAIIFWWPGYRLSALIRFATALVSWGTVIALVKVIPTALELKSPETLQRMVKEKIKELEDLNQALQLREAEIQKMNETLEKKVDERTRELQKSNVELRSVNKELESFCSSMSHDLRTPLRAVHGFSQALIEDYKETIDEVGQKYLSKITSGTVRMGQLIDDLLFLSRVSRAEVERTDINLSVMVRKIFDELNQGKAIISVKDNVWGNGDQRLVRAALECLISNAIKYSKEEKTPHIEFGEEEQYGKRLFYIKDNGIGFDMMYSNKLFVPFQRLHHKTAFEGTGIGLATVKRIMLKHDGDIWVEAAEGEGATFYFTF